MGTAVGTTVGTGVVGGGGGGGGLETVTVAFVVHGPLQPSDVQVLYLERILTL